MSKPTETSQEHLKPKKIADKMCLNYESEKFKSKNKDTEKLNSNKVYQTPNGISMKPNKKNSEIVQNKSKVSDYESSVSRQKPKAMAIKKIKNANSKEVQNNATSNLLNIKHRKVVERRKMSIEVVETFNDYKPAVDCTINRVLYDYNKFIKLTFKNKEDTYNIGQIRKVGKRLGIKLTVNQIEEHGFKDKAFIAPIKEKLLFKVSQFLKFLHY